ncbi:hypothetical protein TNCV_2722271 [Trichonephila clavipes]|nr:hypothetical protein TNCV_2722271 [Trichonephila clavipes]
MSSSPSAHKDPSCRRADACQICRGFKAFSFARCSLERWLLSRTRDWSAMGAQDLVLLKTLRVEELKHVKAVVVQTFPVGVVGKFEEGGSPRCRPRHLTVAQNFEIRHQ